MKGPILKGPRITLRPIKLSEAVDYVNWFKDKEVVQFLGNKLLNIKKKAVQDYFIKMKKSKNSMLFAIEVVGVGHIGNISLSLDKENKRAQLGIAIGNKNCWDKGYAPESIKILANYVFKKINYNRLQLTVFTRNKRAIGAYKKVGFKIEGILRKNIYAWVGKEYCDEYMMSILHLEWLKQNHKSKI